MIAVLPFALPPAEVVSVCLHQFSPDWTLAFRQELIDNIGDGSLVVNDMALGSAS